MVKFYQTPLQFEFRQLGNPLRILNIGVRSYAILYSLPNRKQHSLRRGRNEVLVMVRDNHLTILEGGK